MENTYHIFLVSANYLAIFYGIDRANRSPNAHSRLQAGMTGNGRGELLV